MTMNQESFAKSSQAIIQGLAEGGYIHTKTPKFECFFGDDKKNKLNFGIHVGKTNSVCSHYTL